jgi:O-acetyl-ADP-ribose deacetylase (regulator of RNase III)
MKLIFVSFHREWVREIKRLFPDAEAICGDVQQVARERTAFVSPANCLGFMDGGIDRVYSQTMFPGCEKKVKRKILDIGFKTLLGRPYLPIGSAFCVPVGSAGQATGLICAPTMFLPHNVSKTQNAYHSFFAALAVFHKLEGVYDTLVVTSHCCGYGCMEPAVSAQQMREAYDDWLEGRRPPDTAGAPAKDTVLLPRVDEEQPDNYDNREIKVISVERLMAAAKEDVESS